MYESEKELMDKILKEMEDVQVPESLKPEKIEAMLLAQEAKKGVRKEQDRKKKEHRHIYRFGTFAAACLVLVAGVWTWQSGVFDQAKLTTEVVSIDQVESPVKSSDVIDAKDEAKGKLEMATGYDQIYQVFEEEKKQYENVYAEEESGQFMDAFGWATGSKDVDAVEEVAAEDTMETESSLGGAPSDGGSSDYSSTNTREENVDEGDVVKTDGRYLYVLKEKQTEICIVDTKADKDSMENLATIEPKGLKRIQEIYITEDKNQLVLVGENWEEEPFCDDAEESVEDLPEYDNLLYCGSYDNWKGKTIVLTYDLTDHSNPKEIGRVSQTGYYENSRMADGCMYIFSEYMVPFDFLKKDQPETFIPCINEKVMDFSDVCMPVCENPSRYVVVTSVKMSSPSVVCDSKAFLTDWGQLYVSEKNIYYYEDKYDYKKNEDHTIIRSIGYQDGKLTIGHKGSVNGTINDAFCIDEYDGYLRIITTVYESKRDRSTNEVNVLNHELDVVGSIKDLAEGEIVYSGRLMGKTGYFVTFRQTDPLFSVDFSNPKNPKIIGKLKIPGFSEYLHPWGEGKLLGIGMQADEETGITEGMKLSMFDISDPSDVKEENVYLLNNYYYSEALYDYKSVLASERKNLIGFACEDGDGVDYLLFSYDEKNGFSMNMQEDVNGYGWFGTRGIYLNDVIYVVRGNVIESYSLKDFSKLDDLIL